MFKAGDIRHQSAADRCRWRVSCRTAQDDNDARLSAVRYGVTG